MMHSKFLTSFQNQMLETAAPTVTLKHIMCLGLPQTVFEVLPVSLPLTVALPVSLLALPFTLFLRILLSGS